MGDRLATINMGRKLVLPVLGAMELGMEVSDILHFDVGVSFLEQSAPERNYLPLARPFCPCAGASALGSGTQTVMMWGVPCFHNRLT